VTRSCLSLESYQELSISSTSVLQCNGLQKRADTGHQYLSAPRSDVMAEGNSSQQEPVSKPYTTPKGFKAPTIGEQWRYVRF
jgi:hypothetical protein